jgi:hypothetical protein
MQACDFVVRANTTSNAMFPGRSVRAGRRGKARSPIRLAALVLSLLTANLAAPTASYAQPAPFCRPGESPQFTLGFRALADTLGGAMGDAAECEHASAANGDSHQRTTTGLAFYRRSTNTPTYTNGDEHWALTGPGIVYWTGADIDPPSQSAGLPQAPEPRAGASGSATRVPDGRSLSTTQTVPSYDGVWKGSTSQGKAFEFRVSDGAISGIKTEVIARLGGFMQECRVTASVEGDFTEPAQITDRSFAISLPLCAKPSRPIRTSSS